VWMDDEGAYSFAALDVVAIDNKQVRDVVSFLSRDLWKELGLPARLER